MLITHDYNREYPHFFLVYFFQDVVFLVIILGRGFLKIKLRCNALE